MKQKQIVILLIIILVVVFILHYKQRESLRLCRMHNDSLQIQLNSLPPPSVGVTCPPKGGAPTSCPSIPVTSSTTPYYVDTCISSDYKSFSNFCGINGGSILASDIMAAYNANPTILNCLSYSYLFVPNTSSPTSSTVAVKFHLNNFSSGKINKKPGSDYFSGWLCPTNCPPCTVGSGCTYSTSTPSAPLSIHTDAGGTITYFSNFCGSNGGGLSDVMMRQINTNPSQYNCITYSFVFVPDMTSKQNSRLALKFHLNHYDSRSGAITVLTGSDYAADWLCPTNCPE